MLNEYETYDQLEMVYLYHIGIPYEVDRENPQKIKLIFKGDIVLIKGKLDDFWNGNTRVDARKLMQDWQSIKRLLWVGGGYNPNYYKKNENSNLRKTDKQKK